jgi:hypothetical protein
MERWQEAGHEYIKSLANDDRIYLIKRGEEGSWSLERTYPFLG